jgi:hypothetical protein
MALNYSAQVNCLLLTQTNASVVLILALLQVGVLDMPGLSAKQAMAFVVIV